MVLDVNFEASMLDTAVISRRSAYQFGWMGLRSLPIIYEDFSVECISKSVMKHTIAFGKSSPRATLFSGLTIQISLS